MASDGLWDLMDFDKAAKICRGCGTESSAQALVTAAANDRWGQGGWMQQQPSAAAHCTASG
jgi:hypothetical protein